MPRNSREKGGKASGDNRREVESVIAKRGRWMKAAVPGKQAAPRVA